MSLKITVLYGSYSLQRNGLRAVRCVQKHLEKLGHTVTIVDAREHDLPLLEKRYIDYKKGQAPQGLEDLHNLFLKGSDAFVVVAGEYNSTLQPGLSNLMDHFFSEFAHRPVGAVTYSTGIRGGARVYMHLMTVLCVYGMSPIPQTLSFPSIDQDLDENGDFSGSSDLAARVSRFCEQLTWYGRMFKEGQRFKPTAG